MPARVSRSNETPPIARADIVDGLGKGLRVLEAFDDDHPMLSARDAAERAQLSRTAARRYLLSLVHFGYAKTDGHQFWLTPSVLRLGQTYLSSDPLPRLLHSFIQRAATQCGHTVNASVLDQHDVVYVASSSAPRWLTIGYAVGGCECPRTPPRRAT
jgi:IclR family transcriptional regulator, pca regulon regulatory protein